MKIVKILGGTLAGLWGLGIFFKLLRNIPFWPRDELIVSRLLGATAGMLIAGVICYKCFNSAFKHDGEPPKGPQL